jgi:hypothetical protein
MESAMTKWDSTALFRPVECDLRFRPDPSYCANLPRPDFQNEQRKDSAARPLTAMLAISGNAGLTMSASPNRTAFRLHSLPASAVLTCGRISIGTSIDWRHGIPASLGTFLLD